MKKTILYSRTFKGYLRLSEQKSGSERVGLTMNFIQNKEEATTFETDSDIDHFKENFCIGVNYDFIEERIKSE